jgi:hypothetical protein
MELTRIAVVHETGSTKESPPRDCWLVRVQDPKIALLGRVSKLLVRHNRSAVGELFTVGQDDTLQARKQRSREDPIVDSTNDLSRTQFVEADDQRLMEWD